MDRGLLVVMSVSDGSSLAVLAAADCDLGLVAYEMALLPERTGRTAQAILPVDGRRSALGLDPEQARAGIHNADPAAPILPRRTFLLARRGVPGLQQDHRPDRRPF